jgi:hypothetical protein
MSDAAAKLEAALEAAIRKRMAEANRLRDLSDAKLTEAASLRWRVFRRDRLLREARLASVTVDRLIAETALDLALLRSLPI